MYLTINTASTAPFSNGMAVTKDFSSSSQTFNDGGSDAFDGWGYFTYNGASCGLSAAAMNSATGVITNSFGPQGCYITTGWIADGILVMQFILPTYLDGTSARLTFSGNLGIDALPSASQKGVVTRDINIGGDTVRIHTNWTSLAGLDTYPSEPQITRTIIPLLVSDATTASPNPLNMSFSTDNETSETLYYEKGLTLVLQWGKATVASVQDWIEASLLNQETRPSIPTVYASELSSYVPMHTVVAFPIAWPIVNSSLTAFEIQRLDVYHGGFKTISGTVKEEGAPQIPWKRKVRLFKDHDGLCIRETWSDPVTGYYEFTNLSPDFKYTVLAYDYTHQYNAVVADNINLAPVEAPAEGIVSGQIAYITPGTYSWTCPEGVTSVSVVCIGGGGGGGAGYWAGGGGGGGGLGYKNNITVIPGTSYTVVVGAGGISYTANEGISGQAGGNSYFIDSSTVMGIGGSGGSWGVGNAQGPWPGGAGGGYVGLGGGTGGTGGSSSNDTAGGGGGAGGYAGNGGAGGFTAGTGGAAAGAANGGGNSAAGAAGSGGGVGLLGQGNSGTSSGEGGSGGASGSPNGTGGGSGNTGGAFGGGGGGQSNDAKDTPGCHGGPGAVRIIWPGTLRQFPSTRTIDE